MARPLGPAAAVIITSVLFSLFHHPPAMLHFICFTLAGVTYAWMRIASGPTAAAALMHAAYSLALLATPRLRLIERVGCARCLYRAAQPRTRLEAGIMSRERQSERFQNETELGSKPP